MEKLLWSIAFPGFGQLLNGKYLKGLLFVAMELLINVKSHFNEVILLSFHGEITEAIAKTDYQWLMFYPCLYTFAAWDAYRDGAGGKGGYSYFPFVFAAYFVTVGLIYSPNFKLFGVLLGPIWLPIIGCFVGVFIGLFIQRCLLKRRKVEGE